VPLLLSVFQRGSSLSPLPQPASRATINQLNRVVFIGVASEAQKL
jgi:hypothetical protein